VTHTWTRLDDRLAIVTDEPATPAELDAAVDAARQELEDAYQACIRLKPAGEPFVPIRPDAHDPDADASPYGAARRRAAAAYLAAEAALARWSRADKTDRRLAQLLSGD
jgi:hypothetical protein